MSLFKKSTTCSCGHENPTGNKFCVKCGSPLSSSAETACPACGANVKPGQMFCGKCGTKLTAAPAVSRTSHPSKELGKNSEWVRYPGDFAQKFDISDISGIFSKKLTVEQGTKALFIQGGVYKGILNAGVYNFGSIFKSLKIDDRVTLILVDAGNTNLTFDTQGASIRTKNDIQIGTAGIVSVKIQNPLLFLENYLKQEDHVSVQDIEERLSQVILGVVRDVAAKYNADEIYGNASLSIEIENALMRNPDGLAGSGIGLASLAYIGFEEGAWDEVREARAKMQADIAVAKAKFERSTTLRNLENAERVDIVEGDGAVKRVEQGIKHELADKETDHAISQQDKLRRSQLEGDKAELEMLLEMKAKNKAIKRADEKQRIENLDSASVETKIILNGGSAEDVRKLEEMKRAASLTPEQILALNTTDPKAAGEALAAKAKLESVEELNELRLKDQMAFNQMMQQQYRENAEQMKEVMNSALAAMGSTATARATAQNPGATVVAGGSGTHVVVKNGKKCSLCDAVVSDDDMFCPECGKKL